MRIGIDARLINAFGIGSYVRGLLAGLASLDGPEEYVVFVPAASQGRVPAGMETVIADVPVYSISELFRMRRLVDRARLDLLHVPHFLLPMTWRGRSCRIVTTLFDAIPFHYPLPNPVAFLYIAGMMQRAADRADRVLTISHSAKADLVGAIDCPSEKIEVVHIGIDERFFVPDDPAAGAKGGYPQRYFLFTGKVARHKNVGTLLDAFAQARARDASLHLVMAGGNHEQFREREGVVLSGYVDDAKLVALYQGALAIVLPSLMEGFGLPPLEGMAAGTPAITSTATALVEITGDAALHADPRSASDLAAAMSRIAGDADLRADLSRRGRIQAASFTWKACAANTRAVYRSVLGEEK